MDIIYGSPSLQGCTISWIRGCVSVVRQCCAFSLRYGTWYSDDTAEVLPTCKPIVCNHPVIANGALETGESVRFVLIDFIDFFWLISSFYQPKVRFGY